MNYKQFERITKDDIRNYLDSLKKPESQDPTHKWIGTYNTRQMAISKFFKWLYNCHTEPDSSKWIAPPCVQGIKQLSRKEKSPYKPSDIWTAEEHAIFLKYCPEKRDKCYHSVANDTSARPHELLCLRIKDVQFKLSSTTGKQYAEVHLFESKTRPRTLPLIFSLPYVKDWIESHPKSNEPDAFLFPSLGDYNYGDQLSENALYKQYTRTYRNRYFPSLLRDSSIPERDKAYIKNMLTKPWNPYIIRHSVKTCNKCSDETNKWIDPLTKEGKLARQESDGSWTCLNCQTDQILDKKIQYGNIYSESVQQAIRQKQARTIDKIAKRTQLNQYKRMGRKKGFGITNRIEDKKTR